MSEILKRPTGQNPLVAAFHSKQTTDRSERNAADLQRQYAEYFQAPPAHIQPAQLQRFSLIDPNIQTVVTSSTCPASN